MSSVVVKYPFVFEWMPEIEALFVENNVFLKHPFIINRPLKKSARVQKVLISGAPHPLPTSEKSLVGRSGGSGFGGVSFLRTFSTAC